jgi:spore maturation protein CgeB
MKLVVFGLAVSSSWGNGHATLWRGLARALEARGHRTVFFERDQPFYAANRDLTEVPGMTLVLYREWAAVRGRARDELRDAEVAMVTSFCPDARAASALALESRAEVRAYYDLDSPATLAALERGEEVPYLPAGGLGDFDVVLSYAGGPALLELEQRLGARRAAPLYGSVDPRVHGPARPRPELTGDLSYLGTYSSDRQAALEELLVAPAQRLPDRRFVIGGAQYPSGFPWRRNIHFVRHLPPAEHSAFYASSPLTLNVTRAPMLRVGYCPSGRLFEAAACGVPVLSDDWAGLDRFFTPEEEVLVARTREDTVAALARGPELLAAIGKRARERVMAEHTADHRAAELERILFGAATTRRGEGTRCSA